MNILVAVKQTFDTDEPVALQNGCINEENVRFVLNPYDEYAIEQALQLKEEFGAQVTVVTIGPDRGVQALRSALAMGADNAVLLDEDTLAGDEYAAAKVLAAYARMNFYDLIFCGQMSVDHGSAQTGPRLAEELKIPLVTSILKFGLEGNTAVVMRDMDGYSEIVCVPLPALFTAQQGLNEPRYPTLPNVMKAKKKPLERLGLTNLGLSADTFSNKTASLGCFIPSKKPVGRILQGSVQQQAGELTDLLLDTVKPG